MQVSEFRKELQEAIITLEKIARRIDENIVADEKAAVDAALHNAAVAQARKELASGVTQSPATIDLSAEKLNRDTTAAIEAKQRQAALDRQAAQTKANEK